MTVSVCNNSASLIGFCGFPITPLDLHKSSGPLLNPDPAAYSRHTHHRVLQCRKHHIARKKNLDHIYILNSQCVQPCCNNFSRAKTTSTKETTVRTRPMTNELLVNFSLIYIQIRSKRHIPSYICDLGPPRRELTLT